jgi:hypothetical protein
MVAAHLSEAFIEGYGDDITVMGDGDEGAVEHRFHLQGRTHSAEREVPHPQVGNGESDFAPCSFEDIDQLTQGAPSPAHVFVVVAEATISTACFRTVIRAARAMR